MSLVADAHAHHIGIAKQVVQIAQRFLIGADQENAKIVIVPVQHFMQRKRIPNVMQVDELVDFSVAVAGDVRNDRIALGQFQQPVQRHDREQLIDRPAVRNGLEYGEIAIIDVCDGTFNILQIRRKMLQLLFLFCDLMDGVPEDFFGECPFPQRDPAMLEHVADFIAVIEGVVVALLEILVAEVLQHILQVSDLLRRIGSQYVRNVV